MLTKILFFLICFIATPAFAAGDGKELSTFDVIVAPYFAPQYGSYKAGAVDSGKSTLLQYGARLSFKLGPILIGGEFGGGYFMNSSTQSGLSTADKQKYTANGSGEILQAGANFGLVGGRWAFIGTYYPVMNYDASSTTTGTKVTAKYEGSGYGAEIDFRFRDRLYGGLYASSREFKKITSGALNDANLDPKWQSLTYGLTLTYLVTLGDIGKLPDVFKAL